ncbi:Gfo/Idh/MocA family protein [Streptomyces sp. NPDC054940]
MDPVRIGVIGCADIALRRMLPAMATASGVEVTAVASRDGTKAAEAGRAYGCRPVRGYAELLELDDVQAVYVPLPAALHAEWVEAALRAGKHVLAEKPLTTERARTEELMALARARGLVLMENVMFVHHAQHATVRRLVDSGAIGALRAFHACFAVPRRPDGDIRHQPELGGGALFDVGVYPLRAALHFLGPDLEVAGAVLTHGPRRQVDTSGAVLLHTRAGVSAQLSFGLEHAYRSGYELWGSEGRIVLDHAFTPPADHHPLVRVERPPGAEELRLAPDDQVANTVSAFVTAVRRGDPPDGDCLRQAVLLDEVRRRARRPK